MNKNTIESFKNADKTVIATQMCDEVRFKALIFLK